MVRQYIVQQVMSVLYHVVSAVADTR